MKLNKYILISVIAVFTACEKDLNRKPINTNIPSVQYSTPEGYKAVLAKAYGSYSLISSNGTGSSDVDVAGISDAGTTDFIRAFWNLQQLTTDEAKCAWNDAYLQNFHNFNWTANNIYVNALYSRSIYQITVCNEFIRESTDAKIAERNITGTNAQNIRKYRAEARFLRAYQYWVLMDLFGNPPFVTEADLIGKFNPPQIQRKALFAYIESELKAIESDMAAPRQNEYGRADQGATWALLARIYLNSEVYTGTARYADAITYSSKVINSGYTLMPEYKKLFQADNNVGNTETILAITYDATFAQNYGGTTFLICSSHGTNAADNAQAGILGGGWLGNRSTKNLPLIFGDYSGNSDKRAMFGLGSLEMEDVLDFNNGIGINKFRNVKSDGTIPYSPNGVLVDVDFPLFRLAEMHLTFIEAVKRGGAGGSEAKALEYFNLLRTRAYGNTSGNVSNFSLDDVLNERQRELYWEAHRRTDLIRFNKFTSQAYLWPWKGGVKDGRGAADHYKLFPIPASDIIANPKLVQNPNY